MTDGMAISFVNEEDCGFFGKSTHPSRIIKLLTLSRSVIKHCFYATHLPCHVQKGHRKPGHVTTVILKYRPVPSERGQRPASNLTHICPRTRRRNDERY
jgi:hypothetical protein